MTATEIQLRRIQEKILQLQKQQQLLQKENARLLAELGAQQEKTIANETELSGLRQRIEVLGFSNAAMTGEEKKQLEKKLTGYIREIDKCIAMLSL